MTQDFFRGSPPALRIGFYAFLVALSGFIVGVAGFYLQLRMVATTGYVITATGVFLGLAAVVYGFIRFPRDIHHNMSRLRAGALMLRTSPPAIEVRTDRPAVITITCLLGFLAIATTLIGLLVPTYRERIIEPYGYGALPGTIVLSIAGAIALVGYWRMRKWGVYIWAIVFVASLAFAFIVNPEEAFQSLPNALGPIIVLVVGIYHLRRMI